MDIAASVSSWPVAIVAPVRVLLPFPFSVLSSLAVVVDAAVSVASWTDAGMALVRVVLLLPFPGGRGLL